MDDPAPFALARDALHLSATLALPILVAIAVAGLVAGGVQAIARVHDVAIGHVARVAAALVALTLAGPSIGRMLVAFFVSALEVATNAP